MSPEQFDTIRRDQGYGPSKEVAFAPNSRSAEHSHDQCSFVYVVSGTFILNTRSGADRYRAGETCVLDKDIPHAEEAGPEGAVILVARK